MTSKIIVCSSDDVVKKIQPFLNDGWIVTHCVSEQVAATDSRQSGTWDSGIKVYQGEFVFVLTKA